jgi:predicted GNAT family acetyltransferase
MLVQKKVVAASDSVSNLHAATLADLPLVVAVNVSMISDEGGDNPLTRDPAGFRERTARRIEQNRVWLLTDDERVIFKLDILADTPQAIYLEGIYVNPAERGKGIGSRCLSQISRMLLARTDAICLTVNRTNQKAQAFYNQLGFEFDCLYTTIYPQQAQQQFA